MNGQSTKEERDQRNEEALRRYQQQLRREARREARRSRGGVMPNDCPECARSYGPWYTGRCEH